MEEDSTFHLRPGGHRAPFADLTSGLRRRAVSKEAIYSYSARLVRGQTESRSSVSHQEERISPAGWRSSAPNKCVTTHGWARPDHGRLWIDAELFQAQPFRDGQAVS